MGDLATAVRYDLGVPVVLLNDDSYDILEDVQRREYGRTMGTDIENPEFVPLARSFGAEACRVEMTDLEAELPERLGAAFDRDTPTVVEIRGVLMGSPSSFVPVSTREHATGVRWRIGSTGRRRDSLSGPYQ